MKRSTGTKRELAGDARYALEYWWVDGTSPRLHDEDHDVIQRAIEILAEYEEGGT